jgi:hypothetical protein
MRDGVLEGSVVESWKDRVRHGVKSDRHSGVGQCGDRRPPEDRCRRKLAGTGYDPATQFGVGLTPSHQTSRVHIVNAQ